MSLEQTIQELATIAAMTEADDAPRLVELRDALQGLAETDGADALGKTVEVANRTADLLERVVLREISDAEAALSQVHEAIDYLQLLTEAVEQGAEVDAVSTPAVLSGEEPGGPSVERDTELVELWVGSAAIALNELEEQILNLESAGDGEEAEELLSTIKRGLHTLKGESGVLGAHEAQTLCHEAESAIVRAAEQGAPFPVDPVLALLDWMRAFADVLDENPNVPTPSPDALLAQIQQVCPEEGADATAAETETNAAPSTAEADAQSAQDATVASEPAEAPAAAAVAETPVDDTPLDLTAEDDEMLAEFLNEAREHLEAAEAAALELENNVEDMELINTIFRAFHTIKGVAGFMNLKPVVALSHSAEFLLDAARSSEVVLDDNNLELILQANDLLSAMVTAMGGGPVPTRGQVDTLVDMLEKARKGEEFTLVQRNNKPAPTPAPAPAPAPATSNEPAPTTETEAPKPAAPARAQRPQRRPDQTIKVNTGRLDSLVDLVGELVIAQQMVVQDPLVQDLGEQRTQRNLVHVGKIIRDLQEVAMSLRMVTVRGTFQKMARLVRDVSMKAGKDINFLMEGEDTELDRNVVDEIGDPLVHMVRNACDHGIEKAEDRVAAGKPGTGTLTLRAFHKGGSIIIEIEDDGKGLNREKILKKAIERGIYTPDRDPKEIPDSEVFNLVFLPGFSTADKVTDISGRGVGMDVVRRNIEALRGKVEIRSTPGVGSTFMMRLPLTMAIIDGMVVRVGSQRYVLPTLSIEQSFRPKPDQVTTIVGRGEAAMVRGSLLPVYRMNRLFKIPEGSDSFDDTLLIVLESNNSRACLMVDEILGQQQVVIKSLGTQIGQLRGVSGGAILGDGRVALILDVAGLFAEATGDGR